MNPYLLPAIELAPRALRRLFACLPESVWDEANASDRFTPREVAAHLADWEPIMLGRMQAALDSPGSTITAYDEAQMAIEHGYRTLDPFAQIVLFAQRRAITATWLRARSGSDWQRTVVHPERGELSIEDQANLLLGHDLYHMEQVIAYLSIPDPK